MTSRPRSVALAAVLMLVTLAGAGIALRLPAFHTLSWLVPDSASYLNGDVGRTPAYPFLLHVIPLNLLAVVQLLAVCASAGWLAWELAVIVPPVFAVGFELLTLANTQLVAYAFTVLPEAFFVSVEQAHFALALRLIRTGARVDGLLLGLATAVLILLKPSGYSFIAPLLILLLLRWRYSRTALVPALATTVGALAIVSGVNLLRSGVFATQAYGGYALVGYVGHLIDPDMPARYPDLPRTIADRVARSRDELRATTGLDDYYMISSNAYHDVLDAIRPAILEAVHRENPAADDRAAAVQMNSIAQSLALSAIQRHPLGYLRQVKAHVYGLWFLPLLRNRADVASFEAELDRLKQTAPFTTRNPIVVRQVAPAVYWPIKLILAAAFLVSCAGIVAALRAKGSDLLASLAYCSIALHANFLLVGLVQTGLPRYALAMWPATLATTVIGLSVAIGRVGSSGGMATVRARETTRRDGPSV